MKGAISSKRVSPVKKPGWLKVVVPSGETYRQIKENRINLGLATVCEEARCPNIGECWASGTATFMLLGSVCTRGCRFCSVETNRTPPLPDILEPLKLSRTLKSMKLQYVVLTTVDRDDLPDQGADHIKKCLEEIRVGCPKTKLEILIPDFRGEQQLIEIVLSARPDVMAHNVETVRRLTPYVRDRRAGYEQSLFVLRYIKQSNPDMLTKSSLMVGLGETTTEVLDAMQDIRDTGAEFLTVGQYLQPSRKKMAVKEFIHPDIFRFYEEAGKKMGFLHVASGPLVRSSYKASEQFITAMIR